jgi:putative YhbY family RNA-binding protein
LKGFPMLQLSSAGRRELRARAHSLNPVVAIAENGLSDAVLKEIDASLQAHELIKIRVFGDSREDRITYLERICNELGAAAVQHIGKLLVVYRPRPAEPATAEAPKARRNRRPDAAPRRSKRSYQG